MVQLLKGLSKAWSVEGGEHFIMKLQEFEMINRSFVQPNRYGDFSSLDMSKMAQ